MRTVAKRLVPALALLALLGCDSRLETVDGGGVTLSVSDFDGLPTQIGVNSTVALGGLVTIESLTIESIIKSQNPTSPSSSLMNVEMQSYEVTYSRGDGGTRVPPPLTQSIFGSVTAGGTIDYDGLPFLTLNQFDAQPLSDFLVENGGFDSETGRTNVTLTVTMRFFGRSVSGEAVDTAPISFSVVFVA